MLLVAVVSVCPSSYFAIIVLSPAMADDGAAPPEGGASGLAGPRAAAGGPPVDPGASAPQHAVALDLI